MSDRADRAFKSVDQLSAHMDDGGKTGSNNVRDLIQSVRELVSENAILEVDLHNARKTVTWECVGCHKPITPSYEIFRCTDCSMPFHRDCAKAHFAASRTPETDIWNKAVQAAWSRINEMIGTMPVEPKTTNVQLMRDTALDIADNVLELKRGI